MKRNYYWGYALSGGGLRGFAHLGALRALKEQGIEPEIISGTSVGSIVGAFYADGYDPQYIYEIFQSIRFRDIVATNFDQAGFFKTTSIRNLLEKHLRSRRFEDLRIPLKVIASDIEEGACHCFTQGELIRPILASCSVPIVYTPMEIDGHYYVDGGMFDNFPVECIRKECNRIVGINVSPVIRKKYEKTLKYIIERSMNYMVGANTVKSIKNCDYLITSDELSEYSLFDTASTEKLYRTGYEIARTYLRQNQKRVDRDLKKAVSDSWLTKAKNILITGRNT